MYKNMHTYHPRGVCGAPGGDRVIKFAVRAWFVCALADSSPEARKKLVAAVVSIEL